LKFKLAGVHVLVVFRKSNSGVFSEVGLLSLEMLSSEERLLTLDGVDPKTPSNHLNRFNVQV